MVPFCQMVTSSPITAKAPMMYAGGVVEKDLRAESMRTDNGALELIG